MKKLCLGSLSFSRRASPRSAAFRPSDRTGLSCPEAQGGDTGIGRLQRRAVGVNHLHRQDGLAAVLGGGELLVHYIVGMFQQVGSHRQHEEIALLQRLGDGLIEVLAGGEKLVVPDGDVPAECAFVDEAHQGLGFPAILFPVAQKDVSIKGGPNLGGQFVPDEDGIQEFFQPLLIGQGGGIGLVWIQTLQVTAFFIEERFQPRLLQNGKHRDMLLQGEGKLPLQGGRGAGEQPGGHRQHKQLHLSQVGLPLLPFFGGEGGAGLRVVPDGTVRLGQQLFGCWLEKGALVVRMAAEVYPGFALGACVPTGEVSELGHGKTS